MSTKKLLTTICVSLVISISSIAFAQLPMADEIAGDKTISLDLKGMDVIEVLKTLASKGNMNLVVGSNVRGRVTMFLEDVNVNDAFEIILAANSLAMDKRGDIIYVMTERDYEALYGEAYGDKKEARVVQLKYAKVAEVSKMLNQTKTKIGKIIIDEGSNTLVIMDAPISVAQAIELIKMVDKPTTTKVFSFNYASAEDIKEKVSEILTKGVGSVQIDERTNKVVITDLIERMDEFEKLMIAFDDKTQQVLIEAKILEITLSDEFRLGVDWQAILDDLQKRLTPGLKHPLTIRGQFNLAGTGLLNPGAELVIGSLGVGDYAAMIQALKVVGDVNTLSSPRITVTNNEEAKILVGSNEPYAINSVTQGTSTTTTAAELKFLEIGVKLFVTPTINRDGFVTMKIRPEVSSQTGIYTYGTPVTDVPVVSTTNAETTVIIKDGTTVIIGGLIRDDRHDTVNKVPFLGDIPFLGHGFKRTVQTMEKKELVIFLTPHIVSGDVDYLKVPNTPPVGEERFTTPEKLAFDRRKPIVMDPTYMDKRYLKAEISAEEPAETGPNLKGATTEEYYHFIKDRILSKLDIPDRDSRLSSGDRVKVSFTLYSGGNLATAPEMVESTNSYLSKAAMEAVAKSAPFPPFPLSLKESKKEFSMDILYEPDPGKKGKTLWRE
ncbi:MAG: secretin N-terminal domain-containing protein [Candidatus Omnitrophota bacterium]